MNRFKKNVLLVLLQILVVYGIAQNNEALDSLSIYSVSIEIDKDEYSLYEKVYVRFKIDFQPDSTHHPTFEGFTCFGRNERIRSHLHDKEIKQIKIYDYELKPEKIGEYILESPTFFKNGKEIKVWKKIFVSNSTPSTQEYTGLKLSMFIENAFKPNGTKRYVVTDDFGYIEISKDSKWEYQRKLSKKEIKMIKKIK